MIFMRGYEIDFEFDRESNWSAFSPDVPGVVAAGATFERTAELMDFALELHFAESEQPAVEDEWLHQKFLFGTTVSDLSALFNMTPQEVRRAIMRYHRRLKNG